MLNQPVRLVLFLCVILYTSGAYALMDHTMPETPVTPVNGDSSVLTYKSPTIVDGNIPCIPIEQHDDLAINPGMANARKDFVPDMVAMSNIVINKSGRWSEIFSAQDVTKDDIVRIPKGVKVIYEINCCHMAHNGARQVIKGIAVEGELEFDSTMAASLTVGTIVVYPQGRLTIKPNAGIKHNLIFLDQVDPQKDP